MAAEWRNLRMADSWRSGLPAGRRHAGGFLLVVLLALCGLGAASKGSAQEEGASAAAPAPPRQVVRVPERLTRIEVDGDLREWRGTPQLVLDQRSQVLDDDGHSRDAWEGPRDCSAEFRIAYDPSHLFVAGVVRDDGRVPGRLREQWHRGDAVEIFLDPGPQPPVESPFDGSVIQLFLMPFGEPRGWGWMDWRERPAVPRGASLTGIEVAFRDLDDGVGYSFEAVLPFHNFPDLAGRTEIGFGIAVDDHDPERPDRYQYLTPHGERLVDVRDNLSIAAFDGPPILRPTVTPSLGVWPWVSGNAPWIVGPLVGVFALALLLWGWSALNRRMPRLRPLGRALGLITFVVGAALPAWLAADRRASRRDELERAVEVVRELVPELRGSVLDSYRGRDRDERLLALLDGKSISREQKLSYTLHADLDPGGDVVGARSRAVREFGVDVRNYDMPLPEGEVEVFDFRDVLPPGNLHVVVARPLVAPIRPVPVGPLRDPFHDDAELDGGEPQEDPVVLGVSLYRAGGGASDKVLEFTGAFATVKDPAFERQRLAYGTIDLEESVESLQVACMQGQGVRLLGLTWSPRDPGAEPQRPLSLGRDTLVGVPTDLRNQYPASAGFELSPLIGTKTVSLPADAVRGSSRMWLVYHGLYRLLMQDQIGRGSVVCELRIEFEDERDPVTVRFEHQRSMLFSQERYNQELEEDSEAQVFHRWLGDDLEPRLDLIREVQLPPGAVPVRLHFRNTGPYPMRFRSLVFGREVETVVVRDRQQQRLLSREGGEQLLAPELLDRLGRVSFGVYRNGKLSVADSDGELWQDRATLPVEARRLASADEGVARSVERSGMVVDEFYLRLRGEAWSDAMLGAFLVDREHGEFLTSVNQVGALLMLGSLPVLLLLLAEILSVFNSLRIRLVSVLTVAALVPLSVLSLVLVDVLEEDHETRLREAMVESVASTAARLDDEKAQIRESVKTWLDDLVEFFRPHLQSDPEPLAEDLPARLQQRLKDQMPPAWGDSGFLRFEFTPHPDRAGLMPLVAAVGNVELRNLETQLRADPAVQLVWGVPLLGVRAAVEESLGTFSLSAGRRVDSSLLAEPARDRGIVVCSVDGYPVAVGGSESVPADDLEAHARRAEVIRARAEMVEALALRGDPQVERHASESGQAWVAAYQLVRGLQDAPRLLLGVVRSDAAATLPLGFGRVPVRAFFVGVAGILLLLSLFLSFVVTARISRPIEQLEQGAESLRRGDLDVRIRSDEGGQIGRLTRTFNHMAADLRGRIEDLRLLNRGIQELSSKLELNDVISTAVGVFSRHAGADAVRLLLVDRERDSVVLVGGPGEALVDADASEVGALLGAVGPCALGLPGSALVSDLPGYRVALALPMVAGGRSRGAVLLLFESMRPAEVPLELLAAMSAQTAAALENARLYHTAVEDVYTGALRPEFFQNRVVAEVSVAEREGRSLALCGLRFADGEAIAAVLGKERLGRLMEQLVRVAREQLGADAIIGRVGPASLSALVRGRERALLERAQAEVVAAVRSFDVELPTRLAPLRILTGLACYPEEAASGEFLIDALATRLAAGAQPSDAAARDPGPGVVLQSPAMQPVVRTLERVAPTDISVLLIGETGTGKEVLADLLHRWSRRASGPLVKVHCAALPESLLQSELFGHEKGAFTGAQERKLGRFEQAQGGTIFLDEIGEISLDVQVKLLRVLQEREIDRVGGSRPVPVDVRVVAATNRDVEEMVRDGRFREDLYYRLQGMLIHVPPLRERKQEIPALVEQFRRLAVAEGHTRARGFAPAAMDWLFRQAWPGNVRELKNAVFRALVLARGEQVERADFAGLDQLVAASDPIVVRVDEVSAPERPLPEPPVPGTVVSAGAGPVETTSAPGGEVSTSRAPGEVREAAGSGVGTDRMVAPSQEDPPRPAEPPGERAAAERHARNDAPEVSGNGGLDPRGARILALLAVEPEITTSQVSERLEVSARTALRLLSQLVESGSIERLGKRRGARYRQIRADSAKPENSSDG